MDSWKLIFAFAILWTVQIGLTLWQRKHIQEVINELKQKYETGYLGFGMARSFLNLGPGVLVLVVVDDNDTIQDLRIMKGISVFSRFKYMEAYQNVHVKSCAFKDKLLLAFNNAMDQITFAKVESSK